MGKEYTLMKKQEFKNQMKLKTKERKQMRKEKRARLIVKNLSFKVTEEMLKSHFEQFGKVTSVQLLKKEDGNLVGCGFVQFDAVQKAAKAKHHLNGKPLLGRDIECDFVMPKKKFQQKVKKEARKLAEGEIKDELIDVDDDDVKIKAEIIDCDNDIPEIKTEDNDSDVEVVTTEIKQDNDSESNEDEVENSSDDEDDEDESESIVEAESKAEIPALKAKYESHDVNEGKTIFIKNLPFEATNEDLKECMKQFGRIFYALVCMDKLTEHSKGTGFVKFCVGFQESTNL